VTNVLLFLAVLALALVTGARVLFGTFLNRIDDTPQEQRTR